MTENLMPPAEVDALVKKVWDEAQEKIKDHVKYTITSELSMRAQMSTRKHMDALLAPLIKQVVEERAELIKAALVKRSEQVIEMALDRFDQAFRYQMQQSMSNGVKEPFENLGNKLSNLMFQIVEDVIGIRTKEQQQKRHEAQYQAKLAREEKAKAETCSVCGGKQVVDEVVNGNTVSSPCYACVRR